MERGARVAEKNIKNGVALAHLICREQSARARPHDRVRASLPLPDLPSPGKHPCLPEHLFRTIIDAQQG